MEHQHSSKNRSHHGSTWHVHELHSSQCNGYLSSYRSTESLCGKALALLPGTVLQAQRNALALWRLARLKKSLPQICPGLYFGNRLSWVQDTAHHVVGCQNKFFGTVRMTGMCLSSQNHKSNRKGTMAQSISSSCLPQVLADAYTPAYDCGISFVKDVRIYMYVCN
jgi:hypothetical protein